MSTLAQLRQRAGDRINFRLAGTVTAAGVKGLGSFVDTTRTEPDDALRGSWVLFTGGTAGNLGKAYQVAGNRGGEITLRTPLAVATVAADAYDLYRRYAPSVVRDAINYAIRNVYPELYLKVETEVAEDTTTLEYAYPAGLVDLRQLRRRSNVSATPPSYVELHGSLWEDLGGAIRIRYRPATGQFLQFVGYGQLPELTADTDATVVPDELVIAGAAVALYQEIFEGEAASDSDFFDKQQKRWGDYYAQLKHKYSYVPIPREGHPPFIRVSKGISGIQGPINPAP